MRTLAIIFIAHVAVRVCLSSSSPSSQVDSALASVSSLKPEVRSDILLQLALGNSYSPAQRERIIEEAFTDADGAQYKYPERVKAGSSSDSLAGIRAQAFALGLDSLSLKTRAVRELLKWNSRRAVELFTAISRPALPASSCADTSFPDISSYYDVLATLLSSSKVPPQTSASLAALANPTAPMVPDIVSLLGLLGHAGIPDTAFDEVLGYLLAAFPRVSANTEALGLLFPEMGDAFQTGIRAVYLRRRSNITLLSAIRSFLVVQIQGTACTYNGGLAQYKLMRDRLVNTYNTRLVTIRYPNDGPFEGLTVTALKPSATKVAASNLSLFANTDANC